MLSLNPIGPLYIPTLERGIASATMSPTWCLARYLLLAIPTPKDYATVSQVTTPIVDKILSIVKITLLREKLMSSSKVIL